MNKLSVTVITYNEERNIRDCLESVKWADEIIVVDAFSTDRTAAIAREYTDRVYEQTWEGYASQNNRAIAHATHDWILRVDADERVDAALAGEIRRVLSKADLCSGYRIPRKIFFLDRFLRRPERHHVRLFRKDKAQWVGEEIHEVLVVDGRVGRLRNPIYHLYVREIDPFIDKLNRYTTLHQRGANRSPPTVQLFLSGTYTFVREYFLYYRILDGIPGLIYSRMRSFYSFTKYAKRWRERTRHAGRSNPDSSGS
jgi:glycosyltransferase involved in cell wall biosynthesis